jgi:hypothetical protein
MRNQEANTEGSCQADQFCQHLPNVKTETLSSVWRQPTKGVGPSPVSSKEHVGPREIIAPGRRGPGLRNVLENQKSSLGQGSKKNNGQFRSHVPVKFRPFFDSCDARRAGVLLNNRRDGTAGWRSINPGSFHQRYPGTDLGVSADWGSRERHRCCRGSTKHLNVTPTVVAEISTDATMPSQSSIQAHRNGLLDSDEEDRYVQQSGRVWPSALAALTRLGEGLACPLQSKGTVLVSVRTAAVARLELHRRKDVGLASLAAELCVMCDVRLDDDDRNCEVDDWCGCKGRSPSPC